MGAFLIHNVKVPDATGAKSFAGSLQGEAA